MGRHSPHDRPAGRPRLSRRALLGGALAVPVVGAGGYLWSRSRPHQPPPSTAARLPSLAYFYRPPADGDLTTIADRFDHVILTQLDEPARDRLTELGLDVPVLQYLRFEAIMDDTLDHTWHNQVAYEPGDWARISAEHPDWFLLDTDGQRISAGRGDPAEEHFFLLDPAHPGWREFFVERALQMQQRGDWDGVFLDNVELSLSKRERGGQQPARYRDDESYRAAVESFVSYLREELPGPLEANVIEQRDLWDDSWLEMAGFLDTAFWEGWGVGWPDLPPPSQAQWERAMDVTVRTQEAGTGVTLVAIGDREDTRRQELAYASYLLVAGPDAHFRYAATSAYDEAWLYPNYDIQLGAPAGPRRREGDLWVRDFDAGRVSVNPTTWDVSIG